MFLLREGLLSADALQNSALNGVQRIFLAQPVEAIEPLRTLRAQRGTLQRLAGGSGKLQLVAHLLQSIEKFILRQGAPNGTVNVGTDPAAVGGFAVFLGRPLPVILAFALRTADHRKAILPTQPVGDLPHTGVVSVGTVEFLSVHEGNRVDNKVRMNVGRLVQMGGYQHLIPAAPQLLRQPDADAVRLLRRDLALPKRLIAVISDGSVLLSESLLHGHHFTAGGPGIAVDAGDQLPLVGRLLTTGIGDHILQGVPVCPPGGRDRLWACGFVRVFGVEEHLADVSFDAPQRSYCHEPYITSSSS